MTTASAARWRAAARHLPAALVVAAVALAAATPGQALAHAVLQHTAPHQDATVEHAPAQVRLDFNEPVEVAFGAVRVYDANGARVDAGRVEHPDGRPNSVAVALRGGLGRGIYTTAYRVVSADGHPVAGGFAFGVGAQPAATRGTPQVADLLQRSAASPALEATYGAARALHYAALLLLVGAVFFMLRVADPDPRRLRRALLAAAAVGLLCSLAAVVLQGALAAGVSLDRALDPQLLRGSLDTRTGHAWLLRAGLWLVLAAVVAPRRAGPAPALALALPVAALVGTLPYAGHAWTQSPRAVLVAADVLHVLAAGAWLGGLALLLICFWPRGERSGGAGAAQATARFSHLALPAIVVLAAAGAAQAWFYLGSVGALVHSTYGWALVAKTALLAVVVVLGAGNRRRAARLGDGDGEDAPRLRRHMRAEVALALLVLAATATLVRAAPPATIAAGPVVRELDLGPLRLQIEVEPATVGSNDLHLYLFDRRTGAQVDRVEQLTVSLVQRERAIGPIALDIPRKGPAHYELRGATLGVPGTWEAVVTARVSKFDEYSAGTAFEVRKP